MKIKQCAFCFKDMKVLPYQDKSKKYCSVQCLRSAKHTFLSKKCKHCNKNMEGTISYIKNKKYCSFRCRVEANTFTRKITVHCEICGKPFIVRECTIKTGRGRFCSYKCRNIWIISTIKSKGCKNTSIERAIESELIKSGIPHKKSVPIPHVGVADFLVHEKLILECDGDYWHSSEKCKQKDFNRDFIARFLGYHTVRFTETEIKKDPTECIIIALSHLICFLDGKDPAKYQWGSIAG